MNQTKQIEEEAEDIINHFFSLGATVTKKDYDFILSKLSQVRKETLEEAVKCVPEEKLERWTEQGNLVFSEKDNAFNSCRSQTLINLEKLK